MSLSNNLRFPRTSIGPSSYANHVVNVKGKDASNNGDVNLKLTFSRVLGKGTFGCIEQAQVNDRREPVAVKRVFQDPRYKNRELSIFLRLSDHPNLVQLLYYYYTNSPPPNQSSGTERSESELYLHLVMECFPESLADLIQRYCKRSQKIPMLAVKLYSYQMLRALGYIHMQQICHRDIKCSNLLVHEQTGQLKLCDFGSAKEMVPGQNNVAYISSRYYRAPELIFGAEHYDCTIDIWSGGCVIAEMLLRKCFFMGNDSIDQLAEIIKVLGAPKLSDVQAMNPKYTSYSFPKVPRCPLKLYLPMETSTEMVDLLSQMLVYRPSDRIKPLAALAHPVFNELHPQPDGAKPRLHTGGDLPNTLFTYLDSELNAEPKLQSLHNANTTSAVSSSAASSVAGGAAAAAVVPTPSGGVFHPEPSGAGLRQSGNNNNNSTNQTTSSVVDAKQQSARS